MKDLALKEIMDILKELEPSDEQVPAPFKVVWTRTAGIFEFDSDSDSEVSIETIEARAESVFQKWNEQKFKRREYGEEKLKQWGENPTEFFQNYKLTWPVISRLFRRKAPIRSSEAAVERFFSAAKFVVDSKSHKILGKNLKVIVMQNLWQKQAKNAISDFKESDREFRKVSMAASDEWFFAIFLNESKTKLRGNLKKKCKNFKAHKWKFVFIT